MYNYISFIVGFIIGILLVLLIKCVSNFEGFNRGRQYIYNRGRAFQRPYNYLGYLPMVRAGNLL